MSGLWDFSVSPRPLGFWFWGLRVWGQGLTILQLHFLQSDQCLIRVDKSADTQLSPFCWLRSALCANIGHLRAPLVTWHSWQSSQAATRTFLALLARPLPPDITASYLQLTDVSQMMDRDPRVWSHLFISPSLPPSVTQGRVSPLFISRRASQLTLYVASSAGDGGLWQPRQVSSSGPGVVSVVMQCTVLLRWEGRGAGCLPLLSNKACFLTLINTKIYVNLSVEDEPDTQKVVDT